MDLFDMLDVDHTGEISQEEFVDGVLRMVVNDVPTETLSLSEPKSRAFSKALRALNKSALKRTSMRNDEAPTICASRSAFREYLVARPPMSAVHFGSYV